MSSKMQNTNEFELQQKIEALEQQLAIQSAELSRARTRIKQLELSQINTPPDVAESNMPYALHLLWQAINQNLASVVITDKHGNIEYVNPYFTATTGYELEDVIGKNPRILKSGLTSPDVHDDLWSSISTGKNWTGEFINRKKDGTIYWEHARITPVSNANGEITHYIAIKEDITARKLAEESQKESENRFRSLVNSMDDIVFTLDREQRHEGLYGRWIKTHNLSPEVFVGKTASEIMGEEAARIHEEANDRAFNGENVVYEWSLGGQSIQTSLSPIYDQQGEVVRVVGIGRDITKLKEVEDKSRSSEAFARATLDALSANIAILDENGTIIAVNHAWNQFADHANTSPDLVGKGINYLDVLRHVPPDDADAQIAQEVLTGIQNVMSGKQGIYWREYACPDGDKERWFVVRVTPFNEQFPPRVVVAHENITERVLAEKMLAKSHARLEDEVVRRTSQLQNLNNRIMSILDNVSTPVLLIQSDGRIDTTNPALDNKLGFEPGELLGKPLWDIFEFKDQAEIMDAFNASYEQHTVRPLQLRIPTHSGEAMDAEVSFSRVPGEEGQIVCSLYDITHLKEVERVKDRFISMINHEIQTPITAISFSASSLHQYFDRLPEETKLEKIGRIIDQTQNLSTMISAILDQLRTESRQHKRETTLADVRQTLQDTIDELAPQSESKAQEIQLDIPDQPLMIKGEHFDLLRIWRNLLSNAIKYTDTGGQINIKLYNGAYKDPELLTDFNDQIPEDITSKRYILGLVEDNGHGMDAEDISNLFTRFYRGWATGTNINGTGLGLSLVRDLLQLYGGNIAVSSELGVGTTFCFWIPVDID